MAISFLEATNQLRLDLSSWVNDSLLTLLFKLNTSLNLTVYLRLL